MGGKGIFVWFAWFGDFQKLDFSNQEKSSKQNYKVSKINNKLKCFRMMLPILPFKRKVQLERKKRGIGRNVASFKF